MSEPFPELIELLKNPVEWNSVLALILKDFQCVTGTLHRTDAITGLLSLVAHQGIPPFVLDKIQTIPIGKGIAGAAAERREAVQLCNLQNNLEGVAQPTARQTNVQGALAVPLFDSAGKVVGVLGIGKMQPYEFSDLEIARLNTVGKYLPQYFIF